MKIHYSNCVELNVKLCLKGRLTLVIYFLGDIFNISIYPIRLTSFSIQFFDQEQCINISKILPGKWWVGHPSIVIHRLS